MSSGRAFPQMMPSEGALGRRSRLRPMTIPLISPSAGHVAHRCRMRGSSGSVEPTPYLVVDRPATRTAQQHVKQRPCPQQMTRVALRINEDLNDKRLRKKNRGPEACTEAQDERPRHEELD